VSDKDTLWDPGGLRVVTEQIQPPGKPWWGTARCSSLSVGGSIHGSRIQDKGIRIRSSTGSAVERRLGEFPASAQAVTICPL